MKRCNGCGEEKPYTEFSARGDRGGRPRSRCRTCESKAAQEYQKRNSERVNKRALERSREITVERDERWQRRQARARQWRIDNYDRYRASTEDAGLRNRYGMGRAELEAMLAAQGGRCLLCGRDIDWKTRHVDHIDTPDGPLVRGILCMPCNTGLGVFGESADRLRAAAEYVARYAIEEVR